MKRFQMMMCLLTLFCFQIQAQDLETVLKNAISAAGKEISNKVADKTNLFSMVGEWNYKGPDCKFTGDDLLAKAGAQIAATKIEEHLTSVMDKIGINESSVFTFAADSTYSITLGKRTVRGTYSYHKENKELVMTSRLKMKFTATVSYNILAPEKISLLFNADKLMNLVQNITGNLAKNSNNKTIDTANAVLKRFDGLLLGFELQKPKAVK